MARHADDPGPPIDLAAQAATRTRNVSDGRSLPESREAEEALLGAMLINEDAIAAAAEIVTGADFRVPAHQLIYDAITTLYGDGQPVDAVTVADVLARHDQLDRIGGPSRLVELQAAPAAIGSAARYATIVEERALLRRLITAASEIAEMGYSVPDNVAAALDEAESRIFEVAEKRVTDSTRPLGALLEGTLDRLEMLYERKQEVTGLPTGFTDLDRTLSGLQESALVIVGARPSMGKTAFALGVASHAAIHEQKPVLFFSLEMSHLELTQRILASEARIDSAKARTGQLSMKDWDRINRAVGRLEAPLWIDDNPNVSIMEIRAKARRLKAQQGDLGLVVVDYLQLMTGRSNAESRQVEVAEISRGLKILARELECPVMALSQLSRNLEMRTDKRPMLADLRESGCLTASTQVTRSDTGETITMGELLERGERDIPVWSLDEHLRLVPTVMSHVFPSGTKEVYRLRLASGRTIEASGNHPFLTLEGWAPLDDLSVGDHLAVPRHEPMPQQRRRWDDRHVVLLAHMIGDGCHLQRHALQYTTTDPENVRVVTEAAEAFGVTAVTKRDQPRGTGGWFQVFLRAPHKLTHGKRNPIAAWLDALGLFGRRSWEKLVPAEVFSLDDEQVALFLRHLWATDGTVCIRKAGDRTGAGITYMTTSHQLARDVQRLLGRLGICGRLVRVPQGDHRQSFHVTVTGRDNQMAFVERVGGQGARAEACERVRGLLADRADNTNVDIVPKGVWDHVRKVMPAQGVTTRELARRLDMQYCGSTLYKHGVSRSRMRRLADALPDPWLEDLATSDVLWDRVVEVEHLGQQPVFDATVPGLHNFVADGIVVHNSLEQDADVVLFLYRNDVYHPEDRESEGIAEIIVAKHRNGPTGTVRLAFHNRYTRFESMATEPGA